MGSEAMDGQATITETCAKAGMKTAMTHRFQTTLAFLQRLIMLLLPVLGISVLLMAACLIQEARFRLHQEPVAILTEVKDVLGSAKRTVELVERELPGILAKARQSATAATQLAEDVQRLHTILGGHGLMGAAEKMLQSVKESGGEVSAKPLTPLQKSNWQPAAEWAEAELHEIQAMVLLGRIRNTRDLLDRLSKTAVTGREWKLKIQGVESPMSDWLRQRFPDLINQNPEIRATEKRRL